MRKITFAMLILSASTLSACHQPIDYNADQAAANEDSALDNLEQEDNEAEGAGLAGQGLIPDANGHVPMANVQ